MPDGGDDADGLRDHRPDVDPLAMAIARAAIEQRLFGRADPPRLGKFVVEAPLSRGGVGRVYRAVDPRLERHVALKLLHPALRRTEAARTQLLDEARTLARLSHPNVVHVYEVLDVDDLIILVMELVEGPSVRDWEGAAPRSWRELVSVYAQLARGLEAAHVLGIVHGDFKPANAMLGRDGRARVLDFGLGIITPSFAAPEVLTGEPATPASDQYSLCVALDRALADQAIPRWLRRLIVRGMSPRAMERGPSMAAIADELERGRGWRRPIALVGGATVVAAGMALALVAGRASPSACDGGVAELDRVWNPARRDDVLAALAHVGTPYARAITDRVLAGMDRYRSAWSAAHREACEAHHTGAQSAALLDRRMLCLRRRLADLSSTFGVLAQTDAATIDHAVDVVALIPALEACGDIEALQADVEPPAPAQRSRVAELHADLSQAAALDRAGRARDALAVARQTLGSAQQLGYAPLTAEAALFVGKVLLFEREFASAISALAIAERTALAHGLAATAVVAAARRLYAEGSSGRDLDALAREIAVYEPMSAGLRGDVFARPLLLNNIGVVYMARARRDQARHSFELAERALVAIPDPDLELVSVARNLAMVTDDPELREQRAREAWVRLRDALGDAHLSTLEALYTYGHYVGAPERARPLIHDACDRYTRFHPELLTIRAYCGCSEAFLDDELGDRDGAGSSYRRVAALAREATDLETMSWGRLAAGHAALHDANPTEALAQFRVVIAELSSSDKWWDRERAANARFGAAQAELALGHEREALGHLDWTVAALTEITTFSTDLENHLRLRRARDAITAIRSGPSGGRRGPP